MPKKKEVIDLLLERGLITQPQVDKAKEETQRTGLSIEKALEKLGFVSEEEIAGVRAANLGLPYMDLSDYLIDTELIASVPEKLARKYKVVPLFKIGNSLTVAMTEPENIAVQDQIRKVSKTDSVEPVLATEKSIQKILDSYYSVCGSMKEIIESIDKEKIADAKKTSLIEAAEEAPIVKLVSIMIIQAVKARASDIHIEPEEEVVRIRYRIDGMLYEADAVPKKLQQAIASRIKVLSKLDIAESRRPQDGRVRLRLENKELDIRVSTFPTVHGENVVMRLLDKSSVLFGLKELGLSEQGFKAFNRLIHYPHGIILVTGPTGSGKTTTLYAALTAINSMERNILTIEDPVEYELPLIRQTSVNPKAGLTFANGLRNILRQDPDVIMVGEIRDKETADIAIQAALTGHLVFSTLHTNDAVSALTRLIDMGIEPFLISSSIAGILAQRLIRKACLNCKQEYRPTNTVLADLGLQEGTKFYRGKGCTQCKNTGFAGRLGIFELLRINEELKKMVNDKNSADQIRKMALKLGMKTLREDGVEKVRSGLTTPEEVLRVTTEE
jgi:type IV pilus assembly protein PilB